MENLAQAVVITDDAGKIRFMNPSAERLLARGLKERVETHLKTPAHRKLVSLVRFRLDGAGDIILRILRSDIEWNWQGQPATLMSLTDVTPDSATAARLIQEVAKPGEREGALQDRPGKLELQLENPDAERDSVSAAASHPLTQELSPFQKSWEDALAQRVQREAPSNEPAAKKERIEQPPKVEPVNQELSSFHKSWEDALAQRAQPEAPTQGPAVKKERTEQPPLIEWPQTGEIALKAEPVEELSPFQKNWEDALAQRVQHEAPIKEPATKKERVEQPADLAAAGQSIEEEWSTLRQLQAAAGGSERRFAAQRQSGAETLKGRAEERQAQLQVQQLRKQSAEAIRQRDNAMGAAQEAKKTSGEFEARAHALADELMKANEALRQATAECQRIREENEQLRRQMAESKAALEQLAAQCDQYKARAEQHAEELRQQIAQQQRAQEEKQQLQQKLAKSMASVETFRTGFEALERQTRASADERARENEALRRKLAEHEREEESLRTMLKNLSSSGKMFFDVIEKFKADGQAPPHHEGPGRPSEGGENR